MIAVGVGILVALVATVVFFVVYNSSRKGWQQSLTARESEAADLKVRNGVLEAQVKSCTARLAEVQAQLDFANREREKLNREKGDLQARNQIAFRKYGSSKAGSPTYPARDEQRVQGTG